MSDEKYTLEQVVDLIDVEGLEGALDCIDGDLIENEELARMWTEARRVLNQIDTFITPYF